MFDLLNKKRKIPFTLCKGQVLRFCGVIYRVVELKMADGKCFVHMESEVIDGRKQGTDGWYQLNKLVYRNVQLVKEREEHVF